MALKNTSSLYAQVFKKCHVKST